MNRATIRRLYREGLLQYFGCNDKGLDAQLAKALKEDVHLGGHAPGEWLPPDAILEIYCENGIPNATDIHDFSWEAREFGVDPSSAVSYNTDTWSSIDEWVNLALAAMGRSERVYHEPHNSAVVGVFWRDR